MVRDLYEAAESTHAELRVCSSDINVQLAMAAYLAAGLDGIEKGTDPGAAASGDLDEQDVPHLSDDWDDALDAFDASTWAKEALGENFFRKFSVVERFEYNAYRRTVPETESKSYIEFL